MFGASNLITGGNNEPFEIIDTSKIMFDYSIRCAYGVVTMVCIESNMVDAKLTIFTFMDGSFEPCEKTLRTRKAVKWTNAPKNSHNCVSNTWKATFY